jgi:hypothetical protein
VAAGQGLCRQPERPVPAVRYEENVKLFLCLCAAFFISPSFLNMQSLSFQHWFNAITWHK